MAGLTLGGLASGLDTETVIGQLMAVEAQGKNRLLGQQYRAEARKSAYDQVATKLRALKTAVDDLRSVGAWKTVQTIESSDTTKVGATFKSTAAIGSYSIEVVQLARASQQFLDYTPTGADPKSITIGYDGDAATNQTYSFAASASLEDVAAQINGNTSSVAYASVVGGELVLSGKKTGLELKIQSTEFAPDSDGKSRAARLAQYRVDGEPTLLSSPSNSVTNGLPGIDLDLKAVTNGPVTLTVGAPGPDQKAMKDKVKAFVDAYNSTIDLVKGKLDEKTVASPRTQSEYAKGVLRGDPGLTGLLAKLRTAMGEVVGGTGNTADFDALRDIGVAVGAAQASGTTSADRLAGKLTIDDAKLTQALTTDPASVRRLMGGIDGVPGFTQKIDAILDPVSSLGSGDLAKRSATSDREIARIKDQQTQMDARLKLKEERLRKQFTAMEQALSNTQSTMGWLNGQIAGLATWS